MARQRRSSAEWDAVIRDAHRRDLCAVDVADTLGVSISTVMRCAALRGVRLRRKLPSNIRIRDPYADRDYTIGELADITGLPRRTLYSRYHAGYSYEDIIAPT